MKALSLFLASTVGLCAHAAIYTWVGGAGDNSFNTAENWADGVMPTNSDPDINLVFPEVGALVTDVGTMTVNTMVLGGGTVELRFGSNGGTFTVNGTISGAGGLKTVGAAGKNTYVILKHQNTFSGGYYGDGGQTQIIANEALGTGPAKFRANAKPSYPLWIGAGDWTLSNDITIGYEAKDAIGVMYANSGTKTLKGTFTFSNAADVTPTVAFNSGNHRITGSGLIVLAGPISRVGGGTILPADGNIRFEQPLLHDEPISFNGGTLVDFAASSNKVGDCAYNNWGTGNATFKINADDPFERHPSFSFGNKSGIKKLDINGHDTIIRGLTTAADTPSARIVTSATPATLTIQNDDANRTFCGAFTGDLSLTYDSPDRTFTLTNSITSGASTMTGKLRVAAGTLVLKQGASMNAFSALDLDGTLTVEATAGSDFGRLLSDIRIGQNGKLNLCGRKLFVETMKVGETAMDKGVYTSANCPWLDAGSEIEVTLDKNSWIWTGAADAVWNTPGNWMVNGEVATRSPVASDVLFIRNSTYKPLILTSDLTDIPNQIILGNGLQQVRFTRNNATLNLSGFITGAGGLCFSCETGKATEKLYTANFLNRNNDFAGGVERKDGGRIVYAGGTAMGTGPIRLDAGSVNGSSTPNSTPFRVNESCTIANDLWVGRESYNSWNGWWDGKSGITLHFTGNVDFAPYVGFGSSYEQTRFNAPGTFFFDGNVSIAGRLICKASAVATFVNPIQRYNDNGNLITGNLYADNGDFTGYLLASSNQVDTLYFGSVGKWEWYLQAVDALPKTKIYMECKPEASPSAAVIDLCGNDQHVGDVYYLYTNATKNVTIRSEQPANLTIACTDNRYFGGVFAGAVSPIYAPTKNLTYTLGGATHTTTGSLTVSGGTLVCAANTSFSKLATAKVEAGTLQLDGGNILGRKTDLHLANGATLNLNFTGTQTVHQFYAGEGVVMQDPGLYGAVGNPAAQYHLPNITGPGVLRVRGGGFHLFFR